MTNFNNPLVRKSLYCALLLAALCFFLPLTHVKTEIRIERTESEVIFTIGGSTLRADVPSAPVKGLAVSVAGSFFPQGSSYFRITQGAKTPLLLELPRHFTCPALNHPAMGDWWLDEKANSTIFERELSLDPPFVIEAGFLGRSLQGVEIRLKSSPELMLQFRRGLINNDFFISLDGKAVKAAMYKLPPETYLLTLLEPFVYGLMAALALALVSQFAMVFAPTLFRRFVIPLPGAFLGRRKAFWISMLIIAAFSLGSLALECWVARDVLQALPHFPDDLGYLLRAKWLSAGKLFEYQTAYSKNLEFPHTYLQNNRWISIYPIGWPILLGIGELLGHPEMVAPVCGFLCVIGIWFLGKELYSNSTGLAAAVLLALSPMSQILWGSMLSHAATSMMLIFHAWLLISGIKKSAPPRIFLSGVVLGYCFGIRPLTALAVAIPGALLFASSGIGNLKSGRIKTLVILSLAGIAGVLAGSLPVLLDNLATTGNPLLFAYTQGIGHTLSLANFAIGAMITDSGMALVLPMAFGWFWRITPGWALLSLVYGVAFVPFVLGRASRYDWYILGCFLLLPLAYLFHNGGGAHGFGPRFYYDVFFCLFVLTARGFTILAGLGARSEDRCVSVNSASLWSGLIICAAIVLSLSAVRSIPGRLNLYKGYNDVSDSAASALRKTGISRGIVLVKSWNEVASLAALIPADMGRAEGFVALKTENNERLREAWPGLPVIEFEGGRAVVVSEARAAGQ